MIKRHAGLVLGLLHCLALVAASPDGVTRSNLVRAILSEDAAEQLSIVRGMVGSRDQGVAQILAAWRQGGLYVHEDSKGVRRPFLLDSAADKDGKSRGLLVADGGPVKDDSGAAALFSASDLTPADTSSKLRKAIKSVLDLMAISDPDPKVRRDAIVKLGQEQNTEYLPFLEARAADETDPATRTVLAEAMALTRVASADPGVRVAAIRRLGELRSLTSLVFLKKMSDLPAGDRAGLGDETVRAVRLAVQQIEDYQWWGNLFGTAFRGLSLSAVLVVVALGLAITFGLMGVINMAHGEVMMVGAYSAYVVQNAFARWFGGSGAGFDSYFAVALAVSFVVAGLVGILLEQGIIRFLYKRPLESMLATWGVSLVLQQTFRHIFGANNVQVGSPSWMKGSLVVCDVLLAYNRLFVIGFALFIVLCTWTLLRHTSIGLQVRAVMQNRAMASALGVRTDRVNLFTFAFGSGLAGMAGACLSQIGNVGPSLGQNYIVDCFMIVVLGGVGNLPGTVSAALGVGVTDQILQPWLGAVMGKITVLAAIILFLQWRPAGLFVTRSRSLEG